MEITKRFHRILAMYFQLQTSHVVRAEDLAQRFKVSVRTVYRDMRALEQAGVPIYGEAGSGYALAEGYTLKPQGLTNAEIRSLAASEKLMRTFVDPQLFDHYSAALHKILAASRHDDKGGRALLDEKVLVRSSFSMFPEAAPNALSLLFESMAQQQIICLLYKAASQGEIVQRDVEPVGIFHEGSFWYFIAYCHLRRAYRKFRVDRIVRITRSSDPFTRRHESLSHYLNEMKSTVQPTRVQVLVEHPYAHFLHFDRHYYGFVSEEALAEGVLMTFETKQTMSEFARWYLMFAECAQIITPAALTAEVSNRIQAIQHAMGNTTML